MFYNTSPELLGFLSDVIKSLQSPWLCTPVCVCLVLLWWLLECFVVVCLFCGCMKIVVITAVTYSLAQL